MPIEFHIQTKCGRCDDKEEPSTACKINAEDFSPRELFQFYAYLKHYVRYIESIIDEDFNSDDNDLID